jgi:hypothetical protein
MPNQAEGRGPHAGEFVRIGDQHIELSEGVLKIGILSIDFHHRGAGEVIGLDAYCCSNDFGDCVLRKVARTARTQTGRSRSGSSRSCRTHRSEALPGRPPDCRLAAPPTWDGRRARALLPAS